MEFIGVFNISGIIVDDNYVYKVVNFVLRLVFEGSGFDVYINLV